MSARPGCRLLMLIALLGGTGLLAPSPSAAISAGSLPYWRSSPDGPVIYRVPVQGGGDVAVPVALRPGVDPAGVRISLKRGDRIRNDAPAATAVPAGPPSTSQGSTGSAPAPAAAPRAAPTGPPGTVVPFAGGYCDGQPARAATISPIRVTYARDGALWWIDDDFDGAAYPSPFGYGNSGVNAGGSRWHARGSRAIRRLGPDGRVRTVTTVLLPEQGRAGRDIGFSKWYPTLVPDGARGVLLNVNIPDGSSGQIFNTNFGGDLPGSNVIVRIEPDGRRTVVVGSRVLTARDVRTYGASPGYGDGRPLTDTTLGTIKSFTADVAGNLYLADAVVANSSGAAGYDRIRFANRGRTSVTFYRGTPVELTIAAGTIGTIAGPGVAGAAPTEPYKALTGDPGGNGFPAAVATFSSVSSMAVRGEVLYLADHNHQFAGPSNSSNLQVRAVNLGVNEPQLRLVAGVPLPVGVIDAVAGDQTNQWGYAGDGGPARSAKFTVWIAGQMGEIAVDRAGNIFISDTENNRIRRVDGRTGIIVTVAGTGAAAPVVDDTAALLSPVWSPAGLTLDAAGRPVYADYYNKVIRRLEPTGSAALPLYNVRTIVGRGPTPCDGVIRGASFGAGLYLGQVSEIVSDSKGNKYVADTAFKFLRRITPAGQVDLRIGQPQECRSWLRPKYCAAVGEQSGDGGPFGAVRFAGPNYVTVDAYDNLYVSDVDAIRYVNVGATAVDVNGQHVAPGTVATIYRFPARTLTGMVVPAEGVLGQPVDLTAPLGGLAVDDAGQLYIADPLLHVVYRLGPCGDLAVVVGNGRAPTSEGSGDGGSALLASIAPQALLWSRRDQSLLVSTFGSDGSYGDSRFGSRIRAVNFGGRPATVLGRRLATGSIDTVVGAGACPSGGPYAVCSLGDGGAARDAVLSGTSSMRFGRGGELYFIDTAFNRVRVVLPGGRIAGITSPWPESVCYSCNLEAKVPSGYIGDGDRALDAWFAFRYQKDVTPTMTWNVSDFRVATGVLDVTRDGDLLVADRIGKIRRIVQPARAELRLTGQVPGLAGAGLGASPTRPLYDQAPVAPEGTTGPDVDIIGDALYVVAGKGESLGCDVWRVGFGAGGKDAATFQGQTGTGALAGAGGSVCGVVHGRADETSRPLVTVTPVRTGESAETDGARELQIAVASRATDGGAWTVGAAPILERTGQVRAGQPLVTRKPDGSYWLAALDPSGGVHLSTSPDARVFVPAPTGTLPTAAALGGLAADATGRLRLLAVDRDRTDRSAVVELVTTDGSQWQRQPLTPYGRQQLSPPSLAVDAAGNRYATWSDERSVWFTAAPSASRAWRSPIRVSQQAAALPGLVTNGAGRVAIGFYAAPARRTTDVRDPYAIWYVATTVSSNALSAKATFTPAALITTNAVHMGQICLAYPCGPLGGAEAAVPSPLRDGTPLQSSAEPVDGYGPIRMALDPDARPVALFVADGGRVGNSAPRSAVSMGRSCVQRLSSAPARLKCLRASAGPAGAAPPTDAGGPVGLPPVTIPGLTPCSAAPPPFQQPKDAAPTQQDAARQQRARPVPPVKPAFAPVPLPPLVPFPPLQPALPPGQAPAQASQINQATQQVQAAQPGGQAQVGIAVGEASRSQEARSFAASRRSRSNYPPVAAAWLVTSAGIMLLGAARRHPHPLARAGVGTSVRPTRS